MRRACHALSLDDARTTFHPVLWTEEGESLPQKGDKGHRWLKDERISQVWFAGVHSNVGDGYPDDALGTFAASVLLEEAKHRGLKFKVEPFELFPRTGMCQLRTSTAKVAKCQVRIASAQQIATAEIVEG